MINDYINRYGLINSKTTEDVAENSSLWTLQLILIYELKGDKEKSKKYKLALYQYIESCKIRKGLYNQLPERGGSNTDGMSHDQLTTFVCFSYFAGFDFHKDIWQEIKRQKFRYDNLSPDKPKRWLHPRDIILYGYLANSKICLLLMPLFILISKEACRSELKIRPTIQYRIKYFFKNFRFFPKSDLRKMISTDGKLLTFVRCHSTKDKKLMRFTWKTCTKDILKIERIGSWNAVFRIYFLNNHPITMLTKSLNFKRELK